MVQSTDLDRFGHTNNVCYLKWLEAAAWAHSEQQGLDWPLFQQLNRIMVVRRHELDYLAPTFCDDQLQLATWISGNDGRLTVLRNYQIVRPKDGVTVLRGVTRWVCVALDTGRPKRMPELFAQGYVVTL